MAGRKTLESWIGEALADDEKDGAPSMMTLVHLVGQSNDEIHTVKFGPNKKWTPQGLAALFNGKAQTFVQDLQGVHTFMVMAFYAGRSQPEAKYPFTVNSVSATNGLYTEGPTAEGRTQQKMRWEETVLQQTYRKQQQLDDSNSRMIHTLMEMNQTLMVENRDAFNIVKEMLMSKATDDHTRRMESMQFERSSEERKKFLQFAPALVNTIAGKEIFPQSVADTSLIETIADSLDHEKVMAIVPHLPPAVVGVLMTRLQKREEEKAAQAEQRRQLQAANHSNGNVDPEANAAGDA